MSGTAQPTGNPYTDAQNSIKAIAQGINTANPGRKWKPEELIDAINMAITTAQGMAPDQKLLMQGEIAQAKIDSATHDAVMKAQTAQEVAQIKAESAQQVADARDATAKALQDLKDATAEKNAATAANARVTVGKGNNAATMGSAAERAKAAVTVGAGHDQASTANANTRAGATRDAATTGANARAHAADVAHPQGAKAIADRQSLDAARQAIAKGADKAAVIARLKAAGVSTAGL